MSDVQNVETLGIYEEYPDLINPEFAESYDFASCWTRTNPSFSVLDVACALQMARGDVSRAASFLGRTRTSTFNFIARNRQLREFRDELEETFLDTVESLYKNAALTGDTNVMKTILTTKGRNRGWVTRSEHTGPNGAPMAVVTANMDAKEAEQAYASTLMGS